MSWRFDHLTYFFVINICENSMVVVIITLESLILFEDPVCYYYCTDLTFMVYKWGIKTVCIFFICFPFCFFLYNVVLQLLQKGADPNHMDRDGRTALIAAAYTGCVEVVEVLLDHGAHINHVDSDGRTALSVCVLLESSKNQLGE